ncbi:hypothetical protein FB567DRAFT_50076 [Paraphoma chrysanthemicola]|uniref:DUF6594 domain-containing protein n=1 Tax=Paraphoma chrysanthemicola TaxID=798071 RepID=A0A8K0R520_9PLEO|nr:hypothetical protein FB567DRAFT_50076 [Paraphoma chrysanthemicola]
MSTATAPSKVYKSFYKDIASFPELGRFRRHGAFWAKKVHDDTCELRERLGALNEQLKKLPGGCVTTVLDCSKSSIRANFGKKERAPVLHAWNAYDRALLKYGETLCMSAQVMNLPTQNAFNAKQFAEWKRSDSGLLFEADLFVPTGEAANLYLNDPDETDTCVWRTTPCEDLLTRLFLRVSPWIERHILCRWRSIVPFGKPAGKIGPTSVPFDQIVGMMDMLSCVVASVLLAVTIAVLAFVHPLGIRIGIIGVFGTLFALLLWLLSGKPTRGEVFGATAAFYAVAAVFVGSTSIECGCA